MKMPKLISRVQIRGLVRVAVFLATANVAATLLLLPAARAQVEQTAKRSGLQLLKELGPTLIGPPEVATINGQAMSVASKLTPLSVDEVLGRLETYCRGRSGFADELAKLPQTLAGAALPEYLRDPSRWLASRQDAADGTSAQIACIARKQHAGGVRGLLDQVLAFVDSGDVADIGEARYVIARRDEASGSTHVLAMWTEGSFNVRAMFPSEGDAPGSDSRDIPRPTLSRRVLSAGITGHPFALRMYDTDRSEPEVLGEYSRHLGRDRWLSHPLPPNDTGMDLSENMRVFSRDGSALLVVANKTPEGRTGVSLVELGTVGFAHARVTGEQP